MNPYDLIIIGSGTMGAAGGYFASRAGLRVLLIDAHAPPHTHGAHHGESRLFRYLYHNDAYQQLLNRATTLWAELETRHGAHLITRCGVLNLAAADNAGMHAKRAMGEKHGLPHEWLTAADIRARWPSIAVPDDFAGLLENEAGYTHAERAVALFIEHAKIFGAQTAFHQPVTHIERTATDIIVHSTTQRYHGRRVAVCAGTWVRDIAGLDIALPYEAVRKTFAWYDAPAAYHQDNSFPGFTVETAAGIYYGFPDAGDGLKVGRHDEGERMVSAKDRFPYTREHDAADTDTFLSAFLPQCGALRDGKVCSYDRTASEDFILSLHPQDARIFLLGGFSGHGFKFAPAIGEAIACFAQGEDLPLDTAFFAIPETSQN